MCGIAGLVAPELSGAERASTGRAMLRVLAHRGPDGVGDWSAKKDPVWLGHRRLAIIDLEGGAQPMHHPDAGLSITFNGCIYNYKELRAELERAGHTFRTGSDTEVILQAYAAWGTECVNRFNGMWAFAIWDEPRRRLWCARDRVGVKPFYFFEGDNGVLAFASEIKGLLATGLFPRQRDENGLRQYLTFQFCLGDRTLFKGVRRLEPGHTLTLDLSRATPRVQIAQYWDAHFEIDEARDEDWLVARLRELLEDAVRLRLRADVPLGAHLSGGLDSSTVVGLARRLLPAGAELHTFTGAFEESGTKFDERNWARLVAEANATHMHEVVLGAQDFADGIHRIAWHMDEPAAGPGVFPQYFVSKAASQHVKVVLGGQGGDEIFIGYARYLVAYLEECIKGAIQNNADRSDYVATLATIVPSLPSLQNYLPMLRSFWEKGPFAEPSLRYFNLMDRFGGAAPVLSRDLEFDHEETFAEFRQIFDVHDAASMINRILYFDLKTHLQSLLQVEDRTSMAWGLESRVPLLDYRLIELMTSAKPTLKFKNGKLKHLFTKVVANLVPQAVRRRTDKMGFPVPLSEWSQGPLRGMIHEVLGSTEARGRGLFDVPKLLDAAGHERSFGRATWGALNLELWHRQFIDSDGSAPLS